MESRVFAGLRSGESWRSLLPTSATRPLKSRKAGSLFNTGCREVGAAKSSPGPSVHALGLPSAVRKLAPGSRSKYKLRPGYFSPVSEGAALRAPRLWHQKPRRLHLGTGDRCAAGAIQSRTLRSRSWRTADVAVAYDLEIFTARTLPREAQAEYWSCRLRQGLCAGPGGRFARSAGGWQSLLAGAAVLLCRPLTKASLGLSLSPSAPVATDWKRETDGQIPA